MELIFKGSDKVFSSTLLRELTFFYIFVLLKVKFEYVRKA